VLQKGAVMLKNPELLHIEYLGGDLEKPMGCGTKKCSENRCFVAGLHDRKENWRLFSL